MFSNPQFLNRDRSFWIVVSARSRLVNVLHALALAALKLNAHHPHNALHAHLALVKNAPRLLLNVRQKKFHHRQLGHI
jgi:hypothetical protein